MPNLNPQQRSGPDAGVCHQRAGAEQEGMGGIMGASGKDQAWMPWGQFEGASKIATKTVGSPEREKKRELSRKRL